MLRAHDCLFGGRATVGLMLPRRAACRGPAVVARMPAGPPRSRLRGYPKMTLVKRFVVCAVVLAVVTGLGPSLAGEGQEGERSPDVSAFRSTRTGRASSAGGSRRRTGRIVASSEQGYKAKVDCRERHRPHPAGRPRRRWTTSAEVRGPYPGKRTPTVRRTTPRPRPRKRKDRLSDFGGGSGLSLGGSRRRLLLRRPGLLAGRGQKLRNSG